MGAASGTLRRFTGPALQLSRIGGVLRVLADRADQNGLSEEQKKTARAFLHQADIRRQHRS